MHLALDVGLGGFALRIQTVEVLVEPLVGGHPGVDDAADAGRRLSLYDAPSPALSTPKKRGPLQRVPVMARATLERLEKVAPFQAKPSPSTITRCCAPAHSRTSSVPGRRLPAPGTATGWSPASPPA